MALRSHQKLNKQILSVFVRHETQRAKAQAEFFSNKNKKLEKKSLFCRNCLKKEKLYNSTVTVETENAQFWFIFNAFFGEKLCRVCLARTISVVDGYSVKWESLLLLMIPRFVFTAAAVAPLVCLQSSSSCELKRKS